MSHNSNALEAAHLIDRLERLHRSEEAATGLNSAQWQALRYLARANRFSRTPAALADYLGSTRGTVSQTLIALEQKGHVVREASGRDRRSVDLSLTPIGQQTLADDPIHRLASDLAMAGTLEIAQLVETMRNTLISLINRNNGRAFGACRDCRHFSRGGGETKASPHRCTLLDEPLSDADSRSICVEQEAAAT